MKPQTPNLKYDFLEETCEPDFNLSITLTPPPVLPADAEVRIAFHYQDERNFYLARISFHGAGFFLVKDGQETPLGKPFEASCFPPGASKFTLERRCWMMSLMRNGQPLALAYDDQLSEGQVGVAISPDSLKSSALRYQPIEAIRFSDDFMRTEEEANPWESICGTWKSGSPREGTPADPRLSANPFFYRGEPDKAGVGISLTGYWFWDNYVVRAAVKPTSPGAVGLCGYAQDASNYLLFRWIEPNVDRKNGKAQLVSVINGVESVLAENLGGYEIGQWYDMRFEVTDGWLRGFVDGRLLCEAKNSFFGHGKAGLYVSNNADPSLLTPHSPLTGAFEFDDVVVEGITDYREDFGEAVLGKWVAVANPQTETTPTLFPPLQKGRMQVARRSAAQGGSLQVAGRYDWRDYTVRAKLLTGTEGAVGLCFYYQNPDNYYLLRCPVGFGAISEDAPALSPSPTPSTSLRTSVRESERVVQLVRIKDGKETVLAERHATLPPNSEQEVSVQIAQGCITARAGADTDTVLKVLDEGLLGDGSQLGGKVGLYTEENGVNRFQQVEVSFHASEQLEDEVPVTQQFTKETTMSEWANPEGAWRVGKGGWVWHRGRFFQNASLSFPLPKVTDKGWGQVSAALGCDGKSPDSGYHLLTELRSGRQLSLRLLRRGKGVKQARIAPEGWSAGSVLSFQQQNGFLVTQLDGKPILVYSDKEPLNGSHIGFRIQGIAFDMGALKRPPYRVIAKKRQRRQWINVLGNLILRVVIAREVPHLGDVIPNIDFERILTRKEKKQRKQEAAKDAKLELKELSVQAPNFYDCTFSKAPVDWRVGAGDWQVTQRWTCSPQWTFFGGRGDSRAPHPTLWSKHVYSGDIVVEFFAAKPMDLQTGKDLPENFNLTLFGNGTDAESGYSFIVAGEGGKQNQIRRHGRIVARSRFELTTGDPHRSWFYVRAERIGNRLRISVDERNVLTYEDHKPLSSGHLAFWSDRVGVMIARVRIWYQERKPA